jgi:membrane protease YdiL (CAAX protease family)
MALAADGIGRGSGSRGSKEQPVGIPTALLVVVSGWILLLGAAALVQHGSSQGKALCAAFLLGTLLAAAARPRRPRRRRGTLLLLSGMGLLAGFALFPALVRLIGGVGLVLGLTPGVPLPPRQPSPLLWMAVIGLAPVFEEAIYRGRLLPALESRLGAAPAVLLSSAAFALPHLEPWSVLATFLVGLGLGIVMYTTRALSLCIGLHAGLNLAAWALGVEAAEQARPTVITAVAGAVALMAGIGLALEPRMPVSSDVTRGGDG